MIRPKIIRCSEWGARPARAPLARCGRPVRIIEHHTAGHAPNVDHKPGESLADAVAYARALQAFHIERGWSDSGHNFLITRAGHVLEGRHGSVDLIRTGRMVVSAHCPGQNEQPGIEHEHHGEEALTPAQKAASIALNVWICRHAKIRPSALHGHGEFYATACPGTQLRAWLPTLRREVARELGKIEASK
jgi:hypothetical protein